MIVLASGNQASSQGTLSGKFDGPAELPRIYLKSAIADTPAPGKARLVKDGANLQEALNTAKCGDTLKLEAGATFNGLFRIPRKSCDDGHWIIIRSSAPDDALPAEGTRLTPCYAGVASLPARPSFHCPSTQNVMTKIEFAGKGSFGPLVFEKGANHYRFIGLEITRGNPSASVHNLVQPEGEGTADLIVFDRVWMHGTANDETARGIYLSGMTNVAVVDSYFSDFHCIAHAGACTDSQAMAGGSGDDPSGPYKIVNNFLEAAGECLIFGGARGTTTPTDLEIRRNHLFKPRIWMQGEPGFVGGPSGNPFIVKNLFELKNAQRVLFESNILENTWGGFSQAGFAIVLTPKNQHGNVCPLCRVTDVTLRYNKVSHMGGGMEIANVPSDTGGSSTAGERYSIHDLVFDDINGAKYDGFGAFAIVMGITPPLKEVQLDHITAFAPKVLLNVGNHADKTYISNFSFTNSILNPGERQLTSTGGNSNCAFHQVHPLNIFDICFSNYKFTHNALVDGGGAWPSGNFFPKNVDAVGFVNYNQGNSDYRLCRGKDEPKPCKKASPYINAGTDGKDLGADIKAIEAATAGVE